MRVYGVPRCRPYSFIYQPPLQTAVGERSGVFSWKVESRTQDGRTGCELSYLGRDLIAPVGGVLMIIMFWLSSTSFWFGWVFFPASWKQAFRRRYVRVLLFQLLFMLFSRRVPGTLTPYVTGSFINKRFMQKELLFRFGDFLFLRE